MVVVAVGGGGSSGGGSGGVVVVYCNGNRISCSRTRVLLEESGRYGLFTCKIAYFAAVIRAVQDTRCLRSSLNLQLPSSMAAGVFRHI